MKRVMLWIAALLLVLSQAYANAELEIHFLDVGQGDATIVLCDGESMLIDGGSAKYSSYIYSYIKNTLSLDHLDYIVATHPHEDHIGGIPSVLNAVPVDLILSPVTDWNSSVFQDILHYASAQGTPISVPKAGDQLKLGNSVVSVLHCWPEAWGENDMSIVVRVDYGSFAAVFMADAEYMSEYMIIDSGQPLRADVLKIGHHGSSTSSTDELLDAVGPTYAVISCGSNNEYGHPHKSVLDSTKKRDISLYRTDLMGAITIKISGEKNSEKIYIDTARSVNNYASIYLSPQEKTRETLRNAVGSYPMESLYVLNTKTMKFHLPSCKFAKKISIWNRKEYNGPRENLLLWGYDPCGACNP